MSDDLISRQAAIEAVIKKLGIKGEPYLLPCERTIVDVIKSIPSAQPEQQNDQTCQLELRLDTMGDIPVGDGTARRVINVPAYMYGWKIIGYNWLEEERK